MKINILYLIPSLRIGGAERQLLELARGIDKNKFNITVGSLYPFGELRQTAEKFDGVEVKLFNKKHNLDFTYLYDFMKFLQAKRIDIIQMYNASAKCIGMLGALLCHIPIRIYTERGSKSPHPTIGHFIYTKLEDRLVRYANLLIANSEAGKDFVRTKGVDPSKIRVIHNGINFSALKPKFSIPEIRREFGLKDDDFVVGTIATLTPKKDHQTLLRSAENVMKQHPSTKFLIVGDGPLKKQLQNQALITGLSANLVFTGFRDDIAELITAMDVAVLSSKHTEGCSNFILEAMVMGKAVIATDVGGNTELIVNGVTGIVVPKENPSALEDAIIWMIKNAKKSKQMGIAGAARVKKYFSLKAMIKHYERIYEQLIQTNGGVS